MRPEHAEALSAFAGLVDPKTGIIRSVELLKLTEDDPEVFVAHAVGCDTVPLAGIEAANRGAACSTSAERAVVRACGESVERYCSALFDVRELSLATEDDLEASGRRLVRVRDVYAFAGWQHEQPGFPYEQPQGRVLRWVLGTAEPSGEEVWLPASCVYVPYLFDRAVEPFTHMPISTGLAAGRTLEACIDKGILEILERDALMLTWHARIPAPRIDPESCFGLSEEVDRLLRSVDTVGGRWHLNLLTLDVPVPVISAAMIDPGDLPRTSFGIAADLDPGRALLLALEEAALTRVLVNRTEEVLASEAHPHDRLSTLRDHMLAHATSPQLREGLRFLTDEGPLVGMGELADALGPAVSLVDRLAGAGLEPVWTEVTTPDVAVFGFRVARTVVAGAQPLDNDHRHRYLGGKRLATVPGRFGYEVTPETVNPDPHPFP
jgi:ribosomal protein S12 methylthiotransferase accessory factor